MPKSASIRLDTSLVAEADSVGKRYKRSTPRQIEYWAELGKAVEQSLNADDLIALREGLSELVVRPIDSGPVSSAEVFADLERDRAAGVLADKVSDAAVSYQASVEHPGMLDQIKADGSVVTGRFRRGHFEPLEA